VNATVGAASGVLADAEITDRFMKELATVLIPSRSALFVLTRRPTSDKDRVLEELKGLGGKTLKNRLTRKIVRRPFARTSADRLHELAAKAAAFSDLLDRIARCFLMPCIRAFPDCA
jgi:uncharacterized membrane protein